MPFPALIGTSEQSKHPLLIFPLPATVPASCLKFCHKRSNNTSHSYNCLGCHNAAKDRPGTKVEAIRVSWDYSEFNTDPRSLVHICMLPEYEGKYIYAFLEAEVQQLYRLVFHFKHILVVHSFRSKAADVKKTGIMPKIANSQLRDQIETLYADTDEAMNALPSVGARKKTFSRKRKGTQPQDFSPFAIPQGLWVSLKTRLFKDALFFQVSSVTIGGESSAVLQYARDVGDVPLVLLADRTNLESIYYAPILVCDGTFNFRPRGFDKGQTYTIHAVYPVLPERQGAFLCGKLLPMMLLYSVVTLAIAFLPDKKQVTYEEMFNELKMSLVQHFGGIGTPKMVLMDGEIAAQNACKAVFGWKIRMCYFHWTKAVIAWIKKNSLSAAMFGMLIDYQIQIYGCFRIMLFAGG
jgi:hypothetical protein